MKRGDATVWTVSAVLSVIAVAAVAFSVSVVDRRPRPVDTTGSDASLLVVTWAPSLCLVEPSNSGCRTGHVGSLGQTFILHGLWPQPSSEQYCDVPERTPDRYRSPVPLPDDLKANLKAMMSDSTVMTTHEWYAHGTCSGVTPPQYFGIATALATQAGAVLNPLFARSAGDRVSSRSVRQLFDTTFGAGAGSRVSLSCRDAAGGSLMYEVRLSLPPVVELSRTPPTLAGALPAGPPVPPGCGQARLP
ncbi:MAG: ribonuclease T(2) [Mycobacterium sp.]|nr:ribonuclease T(2) [Mycobacterium sp.]